MRLLPASVLTALLMLVWAQPGTGQSALRIGLAAGINAANASVDALPEGMDACTLRGFATGVYAELALAPAISLSSFPRFIDKGSELRYHDAVVETGLYNYLEMPVAVKCVLPSGRLRPFVALGASAGILVSARVRMEFQEGYAVQYVREFTKPFDACLDAGLGFDLLPGGGLVVIASCFYSHGLVNISASPARSAWRSRDLLCTAVLALQL